MCRQLSRHLYFTLTPTDPNANFDYDMFLWDRDDISCDSAARLAATVRRCNSSTTVGATGTNNTSVATNQGPTGTAFNAGLPVADSSTVLLFVRNTSGSAGGYSLNFLGNNPNITVADTLSPEPVAAFLDGCGTDEVVISFNEPIRCNSVNPTDFRLLFPNGSSIVPQNIVSLGCSGSNSAGKSFELIFANPLTTVNNLVLTYNGSLQDACGNFVTADSIDVVPLNIPSVSVSGLQDYTCGDSSLRITFSDNVSCSSLDPSDFLLISTLSNDTLNFTRFESAGCFTPPTGVGTVFELVFDSSLTPRIGETWQFEVNGGGLLTQCGNTVADFVSTFQVSELVVTADGDVSVCYDTATTTTTQIGATTPALNFQVEWTPRTGLQPPYNTLTPTVTTLADRNYRVQLVNGACRSNIDSVQVRFIERPTVAINAERTLCRGQSTTALLSGASNYEWVDFALSTDSLVLAPSGDTTYRIVPSTAGCQGDTAEFSVAVQQTPDGFLQIDVDTLCARVDTLTVQFIALNNYDVAATSFTWDYVNAVVQNPNAPNEGPFQLVWPNQTGGEITLITNTNTCREIFTARFVARGQPQVYAGPDLRFCSNDQGVRPLLASTNLPNTNCQYTWSPATGITFPNLRAPLINPTATQSYQLTAVCDGCPSDTDSLTVSVDRAPVIARLSPPTVTLCEGNPVPLEFLSVPSLGAPPFTYEWAPLTYLTNISGTSALAAPPVDTFFTVSAVDSLGCRSDSIVFNVVADASPDLTAGPNLVYCRDAAPVQLDARVLNAPTGLSYSYEWYPKTGLDNPFVLEPFASPDSTTVYRLVARETVTGCQFPKDINFVDTALSVTVYVRERPAIEAGPDEAICFGDSVLIGNAPTGAGPAYTVNWSPTAPLSQPNQGLTFAAPTQTTTFFVTAESNGCFSETDSMVVSVAPANIPTILTPDTTLCQADVVNVRAVVSGDTTGATFSWTPATGVSDPNSLTPTLDATTSTTYVLNVTGAGCKNSLTDSLRIEVFNEASVSALPAGDRLLLCENDTALIPAIVAGTTAPFTVEWTPARFLSDSSLVQPQVFTPQSQVYTVNVAYRGCTVTDSVFVFVVDTAEAIILADTNVSCEGSPITLRAFTPEPAVYAWSPDLNAATTNERTFTPAPYQTTDFILTQSKDGCVDRDTFTVTVIPQPEARFSFAQGVGCEGRDLQFYDESLQAVSYFWRFDDGSISNEPNPAHTYATSGAYTPSLVVTGEGGCRDVATAETPIRVYPRADASVETSPEAPALLYLPDATIQFEDSNVVAAEYAWDFGDGNQATRNLDSYTYRRPGLFTIRLSVTDSGGCTADTLIGPFTVEAPEVRIASIFTPNGDGSNDTWQPIYRGTEPLKVEVVDRWGTTVFVANDANEAWNGVEIDGDDAQEGVYFYVVEVGERVYKGSFSLVR